MKRRHVLTVFFAFLALYVATSGGHLYSPDEEIMFRVTESLARRGSLAIEPMIDAQGHSFASRRGVDGREYAQYGLGNSLFAVPLYWLGDLAARFVAPDVAERLLSFNTVMYVPESEPHGGPALMRRFAVSFWGSIVGAATCALLWAFAYRLRERELRGAEGQGGFTGLHKESPAESAESQDGSASSGASGAEASLGTGATLGPRAVAWLVALAYGAGTMALPHARTFFSEPLATLTALAAFYALALPQPLRWRDALVAGIWYGLSLLTRLDSAVIAPALGLFLLLRIIETRWPRRTIGHLKAAELAGLLKHGHVWAGVGAFCVGPLLYGLVYAVLNWLHFGHPLTSAYADQTEGIQFRTPLLAGLYGYFMSIGKSVFLFSPAIVFGLVGWRHFARRHLTLGFALGLAVALLLIFHARWQNWAGGWCWGPRHIFMAHALVMLPAVGFFADWSRWKRLSWAVVMLIACGVQLYGASQNFIDFYILYYRTPETPPNAYVMYSTEDLRPVRAIAPINDSIYVPQNSQWYRYAEMWQMGYCDNLWIRLWRRAQGLEPPLR